MDKKRNIWNYIKKSRGVLLVILIVGLNSLFKSFPDLAFAVYTKGFFQIIRVVWDHTLGLLPFPPVYLVFFLLVYIIYKWLGSITEAWKAKSKEKGWSVLFRMFNFLCYVYALFYLLWGYNYTVPRITKLIDLGEKKRNYDEFLAELDLYMDFMEDYRLSILPDTLIETSGIPEVENLEGKIRAVQEEILASWGYPTIGRVRVRKLKPDGFILRLSAAGVYIPYVAEGHIDPGLHHIQWPFTMAHEMGHGYGIANEGECNFLAFVTCINVDDPYVQYSGYIAYFRYLLSNLRRADKELYNELRSNLHPLLKKDFNLILTQLYKYPDLMPELRDVVYDQYLQTHGIKEGLRSYSTILTLVDRWRRKGDKWTEALKPDYDSLR